MRLEVRGERLEVRGERLEVKGERLEVKGDRPEGERWLETIGPCIASPGGRKMVRNDGKPWDESPGGRKMVRKVRTTLEKNRNRPEGER